MLQSICPKLPSRNMERTRDYYVNSVGFEISADYSNYLILEKEGVEIHFFPFPELDPKQNYGQVYIRTNAIEAFYQSLIDIHTPIHPNGNLEEKPWGQKEFSLLDPDGNLLTFGQSMG
ncbi:MAG: VOC family protein [Bacteroidia bacterium]|nr:VOC family protein [Bacteroidia bacterium]